MIPCTICGAPCHSGAAHSCCLAWGTPSCPACKASRTNLRRWVSEAKGRIQGEAETIEWLDRIGLLTDADRDERTWQLAMMRERLAEAENALEGAGA